MKYFMFPVEFIQTLRASGVSLGAIGFLGTLLMTVEDRRRIPASEAGTHHGAGSPEEVANCLNELIAAGVIERSGDDLVLHVPVYDPEKDSDA